MKRAALGGLQVVLDFADSAGFDGRIAGSHADGAHDAGSRQAPGIARVDVGLPIGVVESVVLQGILVVVGGFVPGVDELCGLRVVGAGEAADRDVDDDISELLRLIDIVDDAGGEGTVEHADDGAGVGGGERSILQAHGDDGVGVKLIAENIGGQVVEDAAIDKEVSIATLRGGKMPGMEMEARTASGSGPPEKLTV